MFRVKVVKEVKMDVLPSGGIFRELQVVHDTGYFPTSDGQPSFEEDWHQVSGHTGTCCRGHRDTEQMLVIQSMQLQQSVTRTLQA